MDLGTPWKRTTSLKNKAAIWDTSIEFLHGIKWAIFENRSTTTKMQSKPCYVLGTPRTKSIEISSQGSLGTGKGRYKPAFWAPPLAFWHTRC